MCKHIEIVIASRNAVVGLRASLSPLSREENEEFGRRETAYDSLLMSIEVECLSCKADRNNPHRNSNFLAFVDEYVTHYAGKKCFACK
jgi:hypothetical protein